MVNPDRHIKHFTIPVFIPLEACPFTCIFCDQKKITGWSKVPSPADIETMIRSHLLTFPVNDRIVEVGFFGGTFTGLPAEQQRRYLETVMPFVKSGDVDAIRISTRPDFISGEVLPLLKEYPVRTIELGAQSMDDGVLKASGRGHTSGQTELASGMILDAGFSLGLQMMIGLPGDSEEKAVRTAEKIIRAGATETRIYPVVVIRGTPLETLFKQGKYLPLSLEEAVSRTKSVVRVFEESSVKIIRIGLHPSDGLLNGQYLIAGPFHPSFRELVMTAIWKDRLDGLCNGKQETCIIIRVNPADRNAAIGYSGQNRKMLEKHYGKVKFVNDPLIKERTFHADHN
ncbi:MAG: radical SAM protein [Bacteroidetes bacterium]|nr:radical SAM protein [Bacteroidota bacterium]